MAVQERTALLSARQSFAIETTLTGRRELNLMSAAMRTGYKVNLIYICLRDVQHSMARVRERVARGGHDVPLVDLLRRFNRSVGNVPEAMALSDRIILVDNSGKHPRLVFSSESGRVKYLASTPPIWALQALS